jgi:hypothetical protein
MGKEAVDDFEYMIDKAIDREELEDIRRMIRDASDLEYEEREKLLKYWDERYKMTHEKS